MHRKSTKIQKCTTANIKRQGLPQDTKSCRFETSSFTMIDKSARHLHNYSDSGLPIKGLLMLKAKIRPQRGTFAYRETDTITLTESEDLDGCCSIL